MNFTRTPLCLSAVLALALPAKAFTLDALGTGSEGDTLFSDVTPLQINASGVVSDTTAIDFSITGGVTQPSAFNTGFSVTVAGMSNVDPTTDPGAKLADGGIDRASNGDLGIRDSDGTEGPKGNGIDALEGFLLGLDAANFNPGLALQITGIQFSNVNDPETGTIINRNDTSKSLTFGYAGSGADVEVGSGSVDVSSLDLILNGGVSDSEMVSVFGDNYGSGNFRIVGFTVEVVSLNRFTLDSLGSGSEGDTLFTDTTDLLINATNGIVSDPNAPTPGDDFSVAGSVGQWAAFGTNFSITLTGMASTDSTPGPNLGAKLSDGGIDRAANGDFGIRDNDDVGPNTAGIDALEGLLVGLDASNLDPSLSFQITGIEVGGVNAPETGTIVNRNDTSKSVGFSASGLVDVSSLDLIINGGISDNELVSIFGDNFGVGNFRIIGFTIKVVNSASDLFTLNSLGSGLEGDTEYSDTALLNIAADGTISDTLGFAVTGRTTLASALGSSCGITVNGLSSVDATTDLGAKLADGGIDRASNGDFGIRDSDGAGTKGNGIDALEGFLVGLDATNLAPSLSLQIVGIQFSGVTDPETGTIVNRNNTSQSIGFGYAGSGAQVELGVGVVDVSSLNLQVAGGTSDAEVVSIFGNDFGVGNFRIAGFRLKVVNVGGLSPLEQFRQDNGLASNGSQDNLEPAGDGVENILKYAFNMLGAGTNQRATLSLPNSAIISPSGQAGLPLIGLASGTIEVTYVRRKASGNPGVAYEVQFGNALDSLAVNPSATESVVSIDSTFERVTVTDSVGSPGVARRFARVSVSTN